MIGQTVSHYRILEKLGEGGMGVVYLAEDTHLGRRVAIKFPSSNSSEYNFRARFLREARAASALNHPNIAAIYDYGETDDARPFIVMELVEGKSLATLLNENSLTMSRILEIIEGVARALSEAHTRGVIHRDIKPSNIVINNRDQVKVLDFGLAKHLDEDQVRAAADPEARTLLAARTQSGTVVGTPLYLSPEQARGTSVDARSDLFALGAVLYECIAGKPAFSGAGVLEIAANIIHVDPAPPSAFNPDVPPELDRITLKALAKQPGARYQSAEELIADLSAAKSVLKEHPLGNTHTQRIAASPETEQASALATLSDLFRRPRLSVGVVLSALIVAGLTIWIVTRSLRPTPHQPPAEAQRWYEQGTNAMRDGAYYRASKALAQAVALDDKFALAHARLAEAWTELDYSDKAKDELLTVSRLVPDRSILPQIDALYLDAITATVTRDLGGAIKSYAEVVSLKPGEAEAYLDLGRAYEKNDEVDKAIENYQAATNHDQQYAAPFLRLGALYGRKQNLPGALSAFDTAESLYQALDNFEGRAEVLYQRGLLYSQVGKLAEAREQLEKALGITRTTDNKYQQIRTLLELSGVAYSGGSTEQAKQYATEAINLARASSLENLTAQGLSDLGYAFLMRRDYSDAEEYLKQALDFAQRNKGQRNEARAKLFLGTLYIQQERPDEGQPYIEQALLFYQSGGYRKEVSRCLIMRGRAELLKGNYSAALDIFNQQLQLAKQVDDQAQIARSQTEIGFALARRELYPAALQHYDESYAINRSLDNPLTAGHNLLNRADMLLRIGRYEEGRSSIEQLSALADRLDSGNSYRQLWSIWIYLLRAQMELSQRRLEESKVDCRKALALAQAPEYRPTFAEAEATLCLAQALSGDKRGGMNSCEEALTLAGRLDDPFALSNVMLATAEVRLLNGDAQNALATALQAQAIFARSGRKESEWRALLIAARASREMKNNEDASKYQALANDALSSLQKNWGVDAFQTYLSRPDIQSYRNQLNEMSVATQQTQSQLSTTKEKET